MNNTFEEVLEKIKAYDTIIVHRHQRPDPDALGSQVGLCDIIRHNFPEKKALATGEDEPTPTRLTKMDTVSDDGYQGVLAIVIDTTDTPRVDDDRYTKGDFLTKIDHHPNDDTYGDLLYVDTTASSANEIITDFALSTNLALSNEVARLLYCGIVGDIGCFLYPATTSKTLSIASKPRECSFDLSTLARQMDSFSFKIAKLQGYVFGDFEVDENSTARMALAQDTMKKFNVTDAETSAIIGTPGEIDCIQSWAVFVEQADEHYHVRLRSKSRVINEIAKRHGGGGHPLASGANSYSLEENDGIHQEIKDLLTPRD